jgi:hypothetical protein
MSAKTENASAAAAAVDAKKMDKNNTRKIMQMVNDRHIPPARVRATLDKHFINRLVCEASKPFKDDYRKYKELSKNAEANADELNRLRPNYEKYEALNKCRLRIGGDTHIAISIMCDEIVRELAELAFSRCASHKNKQVEATYLHERNESNVQYAESLSLYPLYRNLPSWSTFPDAFRPKQRAKKAKDEGDSDKEELVEEANDKSPKFTYYVDEICRRYLLRDEFKALRVSGNLREYCSQLVTEFLSRMSGLLQIGIKTNETKTLSLNLIYAVVELLMADGQSLATSLVEKVEDVFARDRDASGNETGEPRKVGERLVVSKNISFSNGNFDKLRSTIDREINAYHTYVKEHPNGTEHVDKPPKAPREAKVRAAPKLEVVTAESPEQAAPKADVAKEPVKRTKAKKPTATKTETPKADAPKADPPLADAPKTDAEETKPKTRGAKVDTPKTETEETKPKTRSAKVDTPKTRGAKVDTPKTDAEETKTAVPKVEAPKTDAEESKPKKAKRTVKQ